MTRIGDKYKVITDADGKPIGIVEDISAVYRGLDASTKCAVRANRKSKQTIASRAMANSVKGMKT